MARARTADEPLSLFAWGEQRSAPPSQPAFALSVAPPVTPSLPSRPRVGGDVVWPDLQKWGVTMLPPDDRERLRAEREGREPKPRKSRSLVTLMPGAAFGARVHDLARPLGAPWPAAPPSAWNGASYRWPSIASEDVVRALVRAGALFVVNDSGGKDSQAQGILLARVVPAAQLLFLHATLPGAEWPGTLEQAESHARRAGAPFQVVQAKKTFLDMVDGRFRDRPQAPSWPSAAYRQCTSDLKRGPLQAATGAYAEAHGFRIIVDSAGLRAQESSLRSHQPVGSGVIHP